MIRDDRHGGCLEEMAKIAGCAPDEILDFSANINPLGFPDWFRPLISSQISRLTHYPDPGYEELRDAVAERFGTPIDEIIIGNGSSEILFALAPALEIRSATLPIPCYSDYKKALDLSGVEIELLRCTEENEFSLDYNALAAAITRSSEKAPGNTLVILGHPANPTGTLLDRARALDLARRYPLCWFAIDEAFIDFCDEQASFSEERLPNVVILRSMTKILAVPGLRAGLAFAAPETAKKITRRIPPWSMNHLTAETLKRAMKDPEFFRFSRSSVALWREQLSAELQSIGSLQVFQGSANYLLVKCIAKNVGENLSSAELRARLLKDHRIGIRDCSSYDGLDSRFFRVAVRTPDENEKLVEALSAILNPTRNVARPRAKPKTPAIMLQGTASNVGKSILTTAFCRILRQDGFRVAPFKSQNMALNSFVTPDGGEIGRAQALQAQACGLIPDVRMNPILLKPSSDMGSQVVVLGKPVAHMDFREYTRYKPEVFTEVKRAYDSLAEEFDAVILEGAGSVSEVNLKSNDIVNMRMAEHAGARALLVGNIDQGGIFGAFVGTMETLAEWERKQVGGFIINRFRGIKDLLKGAVDYLEQHSGKPVLGIVPYVQNLSLPEEDSLEFKSGSLSDISPLGDRIDVALIDMPRISNPTDVDALRIEDDVRVRIVRSPRELGEPDVLILGGSKNVVSDLEHLKKSGFSQAILRLARNERTEIVGLCGGYQMLGLGILDPHGIETDRKASEGLGLLPIETEFAVKKTLKLARGHHFPSGHPVEGYEIHHGQTRSVHSANPIFKRDDGETLGHGSSDGRIWGTYLHGVFDGDEFRRWFVDQIRVRKGMNAIGKVRNRYDLEKGLDRLADQVREAIDMKRIYQLMRLS